MLTDLALANTDKLEPISHTLEKYDSNIRLEASGRVLRVENSIINFTAAEGKILTTLTDSERSGLSIEDILILLNHSVSDRSIPVAQTHISNIRRKVKFLTTKRISISFLKVEQRYVLAAE